MGLLAPRQKPKPNLKISRANLRDNSQIQSQTWSHLNTENSQKNPRNETWHMDYKTHTLKSKNRKTLNSWVNQTHKPIWRKNTSKHPTSEPLPGSPNLKAGKDPSTATPQDQIPIKLSTFPHRNQNPRRVRQEKHKSTITQITMQDSGQTHHLMNYYWTSGTDAEVAKSQIWHNNPGSSLKIKNETH